MKKDNAFPVTFMMQPISLHVDRSQVGSEKVGASGRERNRATRLYNSLETGKKSKQSYLKERFHDCN